MNVFTRICLIICLFVPNFLFAQMRQEMFTLKPGLNLYQGERNIGYYGAIDYGKMINDNFLLSANIGTQKGGGGKMDGLKGANFGIGAKYFFFK